MGKSKRRKQVKANSGRGFGRSRSESSGSRSGLPSLSALEKAAEIEFIRQRLAFVESQPSQDYSPLVNPDYIPANPYYQILHEYGGQIYEVVFDTWIDEQTNTWCGSILEQASSAKCLMVDYVEIDHLEYERAYVTEENLPWLLSGIEELGYHLQRQTVISDFEPIEWDKPISSEPPYEFTTIQFTGLLLSTELGIDHYIKRDESTGRLSTIYLGI